jgi:predicted alpha/beta hydrolase
MSPSAREIRVQAADGFSLAADVLEPEGPPSAAVLVAPAMGVPRRFYGPFARYLAEHGNLVLVVDYRGIGGSCPGKLRGFSAALHDWGELDLAAGARWVREQTHGIPLRFVGHSVGGQLMGLMAGTEVDRALFVASQSGHWRGWSGIGRVGMVALWYALIPGLVGTLGYLPMKPLGQGENLPAEVAREWARWGRSREYLGLHLRESGRSYDWYDRPLRSIALSDDGFAPVATVEALLGAYPNARSELKVLRPADVGAAKIGHFAFFRPDFRDTLWKDARDWLGRAE